jgi:hypothetical protein
MTLPSFNAEQSLYRSGQHYRSSALASAVGRIRPSDDLPPGSYQQSCFLCTYNGDTDILECACYAENGCALDAALNPVSRCQGVDIYNRNGTLDCY